MDDWQQARHDGDIARAVMLLAATIDEMHVVTERIAALMELGTMQALELGDFDASLESFERVLEIDPSHGGAAEAAEPIYMAHGRWSDMVALLRLRAEWTSDVHELVELQLRIACLCEETLGDAQQAREAYQRVLSLDPTHADAKAALQRLP